MRREIVKLKEKNANFITEEIYRQDAEDKDVQIRNLENSLSVANTKYEELKKAYDQNEKKHN